MSQLREGAKEVSFHFIHLFERVKQLGLGVVHIKEWLGEDGKIVDPKTAQDRANTCQTCALNRPGDPVSTAVALAIRAQLGVKNQLKLRVKGEKGLKKCNACGCVLRLLIWEPQARVESQITEEEMAKLPSFCWKVSKQ